MREFYIAGVQHRPSKGLVDGLAKDTNLTLLPEPSNRFDPNAIKINYIDWANESDTEVHQLGYVPAKFCDEIHAQITLHPKLQCLITEYSPTAKPWERIKVIIATPEELATMEATPNA